MKSFGRITASFNLAAFLLLLAPLSFFPFSAHGRFAQQQTRMVPISRLIRNLEAQRPDAMNNTDKAMLEFRIGRLHAMAYALKTEEAPTDAAATPNSRFELPDFGHQPDHIQFELTKSASKAKEAQAAKHLAPAIQSLEAAVKLSPDLLAAKLGLAWCLEQSGNKSKALSLYREIFASAYEEERYAKGGMYNWSISIETAGYLKGLLDPQKNKKELESVESKVREIEKLPRYVTPIAIPLGASCGPEDLLQNKSVSFDLDGFGKKEYTSWLSPNAAWLVFSKNNSAVESGIELVGQCSFWVFWQSGYEVLRALDDNGNGLLEGAELDGIAAWQDLNSDGICDAEEELHSLSDLKIRAISVDSDLHGSGILWNSSGIIMENGSQKPSYDFVLGTGSSVHRKAPVKPAGIR